jgi:ribosomal-protein-alanine N-acetyltransferase
MAASRTLETPRLRLEPFSESRITPRYLGWLNDPAIVQFSEQRHRTHTRDSARAYLDGFRDSPSYFWAIVATDDALGHIGNVTAHVDPHNSLADLGILIGERQMWGGGLGTEAWLAAMAFLFNDLGIRKVTAGTLAINLGMLRIMERAGMQPDGTRLRHYFVNGGEVDVVHMARFNSER